MEFNEVEFEEFAETKKFENVDDTIQGEVTAFRTAIVSDKERHLMVIKDAFSGREYTVWINGVLKGKLASANAEVGSTVKIVFQGKKKSPVSSFEYNDFKLYIGKD